MNLSTTFVCRGMALAAVIGGMALFAGCGGESADVAKGKVRQDYEATKPAKAVEAQSLTTRAGASLCAADERVVFACTFGNGGKAVSLCASRELREDSGRVYYVYGTKDKLELVFPDKGLPPQGRFKRTHLMFAGNTGGHAFSFENGGYTYALYSISGTGFENQGLVVYQRDAKRALSEQPCDPGSFIASDDPSISQVVLKWSPDSRIKDHGLPSVK